MRPAPLPLMRAEALGVSWHVPTETTVLEKSDIVAGL